MNLALKLTVIILLSSNVTYSQIRQRDVYNCVKNKIDCDSCVYLRDFNSKHGKPLVSWQIELNAGTIYILQLCGGSKRLKRRAPNAKIKLFYSRDSTFNEPINTADIGSDFTFHCKKDGIYNVTIETKTHVKYGAAVGILYYKGKFMSK